MTKFGLRERIAPIMGEWPPRPAVFKIVSITVSLTEPVAPIPAEQEWEYGPDVMKVLVKDYPDMEGVE